MADQVGVAMENLRDPDWEKNWQQWLEMLEDPTIAAHMGLEWVRFRYLHCETHLVNMVGMI